MEPQLEHANIRVLDIEETLRFLGTAMPGFRVRGGKRTPHGSWDWVHVGTAAAVRKRLEAAGYSEG